MNKTTVYWICQIFGWFAFVFINAVFIGISNEASLARYLSLLLLFLLGITFSHLYRYVIIRFKWLSVKTASLIPRFLFSAILLGTVTYALGGVFNSIISFEKIQFTKSDIAGALNLSFIYLVWSLIYFLVNFIENYRKEEIKNLRFEASMNEIELNKLKSQLNPHFMFNAMNSIRALIDENPEKSKLALTQFSNVLRNVLQMGKTKLVPFSQEIQLVKDYLDVESIRYEERLKVNYNLDNASNEFEIPPMMLQTLVENAIKHGISKYAKGGYIIVSSAVEKEMLKVTIKNTGKLSDENIDESKGYGINNTKQRLNLLYGNMAFFKIEQSGDNEVTCTLLIPKNTLQFVNHS
ncbi:MAG: sensor histidine kinase [Bacteroidia bacterium]